MFPLGKGNEYHAESEVFKGIEDVENCTKNLKVLGWIQKGTH